MCRSWYGNRLICRHLVAGPLVTLSEFRSAFRLLQRDHGYLEVTMGL